MSVNTFRSVFYTEFTCNHKRNNFPVLAIPTAMKSSLGLVIITESVTLEFLNSGYDNWSENLSAIKSNLLEIYCSPNLNINFITFFIQITKSI